MTAPTLVVVILVDAAGKNGVCSNCNKPAEIDTAHSCGARVTGLAINAEYAPDPSFRLAARISDMRVAGLEFVGVGRVVTTDNGYRFELTRQPGDLH